MTKRCSKCGETKIRAMFSKASKKDGLHSWCKVCKGIGDKARIRIPAHGSNAAYASASYDEIAAALGTSRQNVWNIERRALKKIHDALIAVGICADDLRDEICNYNVEDMI
jgi:DNA-directed RNA polymerase sigma subunit (sigma70/sigma32)